MAGLGTKHSGLCLQAAEYQCMRDHNSSLLYNVILLIMHLYMLYRLSWQPLRWAITHHDQLECLLYNCCTIAMDVYASLAHLET